jgi:hypothetical protein
MASHPAHMRPTSHVSWQVDRRVKNAGREDDRNALFQQAALMHAPDLTVLTH